jgi:hypothetical protein
MDIEYKKDQDVVNPARPEWGIGTILEVEQAPDRKARRVRVRFQGAGVKTLMIPPGNLALPNAAVNKDKKANESPGSEEVDAARLTELPEIIFDRQADMEARIRALLEQYRFTDDPKGIFDWAVVKLGHKDPLSLFSADELASHFDAFCRRRDWVFKQFYRETVRAGLKEQFDSLLDRLARPELRQQIRKLLR